MIMSDPHYIGEAIDKMIKITDEWFYLPSDYDMGEYVNIHSMQGYEKYVEKRLKEIKEDGE